jgi:cytochrome d ubiquinol oxidase subunit II
LKLDGELHERVVKLSKKIYFAAVAITTVLLIATYAYTDITSKLGVDPGVIPIASYLALLVTYFFINRRMEGWAFVMTSLHIVLTQVTFFLLMFPRVMISSTDPDYSLTIYNASSSQYTLTVMSIVALIFVPVVLAYQGWTYYMFRKRISADKQHLVY